MSFPIETLFLAIVVSIFLTIITNIVVSSLNTVLPWWIYLIFFVAYALLIYWVVANRLEKMQQTNKIEEETKKLDIENGSPCFY